MTHAGLPIGRVLVQSVVEQVRLGAGSDYGALDLRVPLEFGGGGVDEFRLWAVAGCGYLESRALDCSAMRNI